MRTLETGLSLQVLLFVILLAAGALRTAIIEDAGGFDSMHARERVAYHPPAADEYAD